MKKPNPWAAGTLVLSGLLTAGLLALPVTAVASSAGDAKLAKHGAPHLFRIHSTDASRPAWRKPRTGRNPRIWCCLRGGHGHGLGVWLRGSA